jgi:hypothetical protein
VAPGSEVTEPRDAVRSAAVATYIRRPLSREPTVGCWLASSAKPDLGRRVLSYDESVLNELWREPKLPSRIVGSAVPSTKFLLLLRDLLPDLLPVLPCRCQPFRSCSATMLPEGVDASVGWPAEGAGEGEGEGGGEGSPPKLGSRSTETVIRMDG